MRNLLKITIATAAFVSSSAFADLSAKAGYVTDYYYRGSNLGDGGAYGGVDLEQGGFYAGVWSIDDGNDGLEVDFYVGYSLAAGPAELGFGYTVYEYTYSSNSESEVHLSLAVGPVGIKYLIGEDKQDGGDYDYDFFAISAGNDIYSATLGTYSHKATGISATSPVLDAANDYDYLEVSAGGEVTGLDMSVTLGSVLNSHVNGDDGYLFLDISKGFEL